MTTATNRLSIAYDRMIMNDVQYAYASTFPPQPDATGSSQLGIIIEKPRVMRHNDRDRGQGGRGAGDRGQGDRGQGDRG